MTKKQFTPGIMDEREMELELNKFWMTFCNREKLDFDFYYRGVEIAKKDIEYYFRNSLWILVDKIKAGMQYPKEHAEAFSALAANRESGKVEY